MKHLQTAALAAAIVVLGAAAASAAPQCHYSVASAKPNKLYLYFPPASDPGYPEFGIPSGAPATHPAHAFNIADLPSYTATASGTPAQQNAALRSAVFDVVSDDYCEFNVEVIATTAMPPATFAHRNTVAVTTDDGTAAGGLFGLAQAVDTGDPTAVDFAYEWGATYQGLYGGAGGALNGANSTLERWARAIGGTAAHEAGHNYGLSHSDGLPLAPGEDVLVHHIMASGSHYSGDDRAGYRRHFSDHEYSVLAANVGLSTQTVWNWDFANPNAQTATKLRMDVLSSQASLSVTYTYLGSWSPWSTPTVSASLGTQVFKGVTYNRFQITWSVPKAWDGHMPGNPGPSPGVAGQVAGGATFHIGADLSGVNHSLPDAIIVTDVTLFDASNAALALHPRAMGFDSGALDAATGDFSVQAVNFAGALRLDNVRVQLLPRLLAIESMVFGNERLLDPRKQPFQPWGKPAAVRLGKVLEKGQVLSIPVAKLAKRNILERVSTDCDRGDRLQGRDTALCRPGVNVDLFPATAVLLEITVTDPSVKHWDIEKKQYVTGPLTTHSFLQFAGRHPDLNKNGVDDAIDILMQKAQDRNGDGVPDDIQNR